MDLLSELTPPQREAVTHVDGPLLVLAGAGSGKTRVITRRVAYMVSQGIPPSQILALTFTNKAAGEMRERIAALVPDRSIWIGTFHSVCARLLRTYAPMLGVDRGFSIHDQSDRLRAIREALRELDLDDSGPSPERIEAVISRAKNDLLSPPDLAKRARDADDAIAAKVYAKYQKRLTAQSALDFDDLIFGMAAILRDYKEVRAALDARFRYILVDEYQDTNLAQYALLRAISVEHPNLCVTGDPDQSIYAWRGANLSNILEFEHDYPGCKVVKLEHNYRSTKTILRVADRLIKFNKRRKPKSLITENPEGDPVTLDVLANEGDEARFVAESIRERVERGTYQYGDVSVFCRVTALTRNLEAAFRRFKVPYQVVGGVSFYERQEIKDILAYLKLLANPKDDAAFLRIANVPPRGLGQTSMEKLTERAKVLELPLLAMARQAHAVPGLKDKAARSLRDFTMLIDELAELRERPSAEEGLRSVLALTNYRQYLSDGAPGESDDRLANIDELVSAAREYDRMAEIPSLSGFLEEISLATSLDRWNDESGVVTIMTLHAAKGLEFPLVHIIGLEQGLLPHSRAGEDPSEIEEERRLFFVGITRARRELRLSYCQVREFRGQRLATVPSCFLSELPDDDLEVRDHTAAYEPPKLRKPAVAAPSALTRPRLMTGADLARLSGGNGHDAGTSSPAPSASPAPGAPGDLDSFRPGVTVLHASYGVGRITAIDGAGPNRKGKIMFPGVGEKTFVLAKTPLRLLGRRES